MVPNRAEELYAAAYRQDGPLYQAILADLKERLATWDGNDIMRLSYTKYVSHAKSPYEVKDALQTIGNLLELEGWTIN